MCQGDGKMRWQIGGNVEPVKTICELNWHECPSAILNYIWSEIVTDVVECLSSETMLWRILATIVLCALVAHTVYYKIRWMDETAINRENLNRVGFKVQDLELKVNILTYKMQYGAWPLPRDFHNTEFEENELHKLKLTLSNSKQRNGWIKHLLLSPKQNGRSFMPCSKTESRSVESLARLVDLETKYIPSRVYHDMSPGGSNMARTSSSAILNEKSTRHTKVSDVRSKNKFLSHHDVSKSDNVIVRYENIEKTKLTTKKCLTSNGDVSKKKYTNNLQTVSYEKSKKPFEKLIRVADECRKFMKDIKGSKKNFRPIDSLSNECKNENRPTSETAKINENVEKEAPGDNHKKANERERGDDTRIEEEEKHREKYFDNFLNTSNNVTLITSHEETRTPSPSVTRVFKSDVEDNLKETKTLKLLPPNLSITVKKMPDPKPLSETKTETVLEIDESLKNKVIRSTCEPKSTNAILDSVKDKLENLHKVLKSYDAQNHSEVAHQIQVKTLQGISKVKESMESTYTEDLCNAQENKNVNKIFSTNTDQFREKDEMSSSNEKCDINETTRSTDSSVHGERRLNVLNINEKTADDNRQKLKKSISNEDWRYENDAEATEIKNDNDDDRINENKIIGSDRMMNESEKKIRNFYCLTSISNNTSSVSSRESFSSSPRNEILVSQKLSGNEIVYQSQVNSSSNLKEEINSRSKTALRNKEELYSTKMETEEDTTAISQTSSQSEILNSSDLELESKSTVQLLQEALVFKKVLISQMEMENSARNLKDEKQINNKENNKPSTCDEFSWNENENHFQSKLLDIISEEQSASSSTEKTGKNSNKNCTKDRFQNDSNILKPCLNNDDLCKKSKDVLATGSHEYFSLTDMEISEKNLETFIRNEDSMLNPKIEIKSKVEIKKLNCTEKTDSSLEKTTCTINTSGVTILNNIEKEPHDNNDATLNKKEVCNKVYSIEKKNLLGNNVHQLYLQNIQHAQNDNKVFLHNQNEAMQEAIRQQEKNKDLNIVQAQLDHTSQNPTAESSSDEDVKQFVNPFRDTKSKSWDMFNTRGTSNLECPKISGPNFNKKLNNLSLQRLPGIFSLPDSKTLNIEDNLASFDNDEKSMNTSTLQQYISTQKNDLDNKCNIQSYSLNEVLHENAMNIFTLNKLNKNDQNSLVTNELQENGSPLTGRTVVLPMNNMFIDDCEESVERNIGITPQIDVMHDLILLENTLPELNSHKDKMDTGINERNKDTNYSSLELSINVNPSKCEEERLDGTQPIVNTEEQILKYSISNINSQPSSLYFTDEASLSEIKLNSVCFLNLNVAQAQNLQTKKNVTNDNMCDTEDQTVEVNKSMCIINKLHDVKRLRVNPADAVDVKNTKSINLENNAITQELDTEMLNTNTLTENDECNEHKIHDLNVKINTPLINKSSMNDILQTTDIDSKNVIGHICIAEKDSNTEKLILEPLISTANLNSDTSNSFVSANNQDVVKSNSIDIKLDRPILNGPFNKSEISSVNKSTRCSSASQLSRLPWSTRTTPLSSASSLKSKILEKPILTKPEVIHSREKMKCKSIDLKISRNDNQQISGKSHSSLKFNNQPAKYLSSQSGTEIPQRRSRSSVTPRKSQISPRDDNIDNFDNRGNQTSRSRDYTPRLAKKNIEGNVTTSKSQLKTTTKTISKSCIPILKSRLETDKKFESEMRSRSPARGPMTITSSQLDGAPCTLTQIEVTSDLVEGNTCQSQCLTEKEIEDHNESGDIINVLELQDISQQYTDLEQIHISNNSSIGDSDRSIIYMNIVTDHDHTTTGVVDPKTFIECVQGNELKVENIDKDRMDRDDESEKPTSVSPVERVSPILTATVIDDNLLTDKGGIKSSKIVMTDVSKDSCCTGTEHKEIEVSVKPSVTDTSTSISDIPDISQGPKNLMEAFKIFKVPKELTKEEYIILLETLNQDPNLVQFRRMQKLCSKLGLGFRE